MQPQVVTSLRSLIAAALIEGCWSRFLCCMDSREPLQPRQQSTQLAQLPTHRARALGRLPRRRAPGRAADVMLPRLEPLAALGAVRQLRAVAALAAAAAHVGRRPVVHLEAPELGERALAAREGAEPPAEVVRGGETWFFRAVCAVWGERSVRQGRGWGALAPWTETRRVGDPCGRPRSAGARCAGKCPGCVVVARAPPPPMARQPAVQPPVTFAPSAANIRPSALTRARGQRGPRGRAKRGPRAPSLLYSPTHSKNRPGDPALHEPPLSDTRADRWRMHHIQNWDRCN